MKCTCRIAMLRVWRYFLWDKSCNILPRRHCKYLVDTSNMMPARFAHMYLLCKLCIQWQTKTRSTPRDKQSISLSLRY